VIYFFFIVNMVCSHCKLPGHNYKTCPTISSEELQEKIQKNKDKKILQAQYREQRIRIQRQRQIEQENNRIFSYEILNPCEHELVLYWGDETRTYIQRFAYVGSHSSHTFDARKKCRIIVIPFLEVCDNSPDAIGRITLNSDKTVPYTTLYDEYLKDIDYTTILIEKHYTPPKTEIEKWKECALKSKYLLDQIIMLGGKKYENLEPILDMVQDIVVPETTELDKEIAGVPSTLTNVT
jgi:hypothetical protein